MTLEEFKKLTKEEYSLFVNEHKEEKDALMEGLVKEAYEKYREKVFKTNGVFFALDKDCVLEISSDAGYEARGGWFPDITQGPLDEQKELVSSLMKEYNFDEYMFTYITDEYNEYDWNDPDIVNELLEERGYYELDESDYEDEDCEPFDINCCRDDDKKAILSLLIIRKFQELINEGDFVFNSVNVVSSILEDWNLRSDRWYYNWEGKWIDLYNNIIDCGEPAGTFDGCSEYEWKNILNNLDEYVY